MRFIPRLLPYVRPYLGLAALSVLVTVLAVVAGLAAPWPMKVLVDSVLANVPVPELLSGPLGCEAALRSLAASTVRCARLLPVRGPGTTSVAAVPLPHTATVANETLHDRTLSLTGLCRS